MNDRFQHFFPQKTLRFLEVTASTNYHLEKVHHPHQIRISPEYLAHLYLIQLVLFLHTTKTVEGRPRGFDLFYLHLLFSIAGTEFTLTDCREHQHCYTPDQLLRLHASGNREHDAELTSLVRVCAVPFLRKSATPC